jgi:D-aspartate ligase
MMARRLASDDRPLAVVLGLSPTGLAVTRALARRGIEVVGVDEGRTPASFSRSLRFVHAPVRGDDAWVGFLLALARRAARPPVLLWTSDVHAERIARVQGALRQDYRFISAGRQLVEDLASKIRFAALASDLELPVPRSVRLSEVGADVETFLPCVVKPDGPDAWSAQVLAERGVAPAKAIPVFDRAGLENVRHRLGDIAESLVIQEMVLGPDENHIDYHALIGDDGAVHGEFVGRKLRLAPPHYGLGTFVESTHDEEVRAIGREVLRRLGYLGVANINFKRDVRTGRVMLLEVNPRFSLWTGLDVHCGVDLPYWTYLLSSGSRPATQSDYPDGQRWMHWLWDLASVGRAHERRSWMLRWSCDLLRSDLDAMASLADPVPAVADVGGALWKRVRRLG